MHIRMLAWIIAIPLIGAREMSAQKPQGRTSIQMVGPADEQQCPGGGNLVRRADAPEDKNRNGYICEDARQGGAVRDDRGDGWFFSRGEFFAGRRRGNVGPLPGDTTQEEGFLGRHGPMAELRRRMKARTDSAGSNYVSCSGEHSRSSVAPALRISGARHRLLSGPDTRLCLTRDALPRPSGELYVLNQSFAAGHDSAGAVGGWRTWVTVFDPDAYGNAEPARSLDVLARRTGAATGFAVDQEGRVYIATAPWQERSQGSIEVFAARSNGNVTPIRTIYGQKGVHSPVGIALDLWDSLYVTNKEYAAIRVYSPLARADSHAVRLIGGMSTGLVHPTGLALDRKQRLFVADQVADIRIFNPGATGDVEPWRVISPRHQFKQLAHPHHVVVDGRGSIYVRGGRGAGIYPSDAFGISEPLKSIARDSAPALFAVDWVDRVYVLRRDTVSVYEPGGWIDRAPSRVLAVPAGVTGMAVDRSGWLYLANGDSSLVAVYPPWARGSAAPARTIAGDRTRLSRPSGLALDRHDNLYVVNDRQPAEPAVIRAYDPGTRGGTQPARVISGSRTGLNAVTDLAVDSRGDLYVAQHDRVTTFDASAAGDEAPKRTLAGPETELEYVRRIAIGRGDTLYVLMGNDHPIWWSGPTSRRPRRETSLAVYPPMAGGDTAPVRTIAITREGRTEGMDGGLLSPSGMAVDSTGAVHLSFCHPSPTVVTYEAGASGAVTPSRVLQPADTAAFTGPAGLTMACWFGFQVVGKTSLGTGAPVRSGVR